MEEDLRYLPGFGGARLSPALLAAAACRRRRCHLAPNCFCHLPLPQARRRARRCLGRCPSARIIRGCAHMDCMRSSCPARPSQRPERTTGAAVSDSGAAALACQLAGFWARSAYCMRARWMLLACKQLGPNCWEARTGCRSRVAECRVGLSCCCCSSSLCHRPPVAPSHSIEQALLLPQGCTASDRLSHTSRSTQSTSQVSSHCTTVWSAVAAGAAGCPLALQTTFACRLLSLRDHGCSCAAVLHTLLKRLFW